MPVDRKTGKEIPAGNEADTIPGFENASDKEEFNKRMRIKGEAAANRQRQQTDANIRGGTFYPDQD